MYLDRRLWTFTAGVRTRILATVALGLLAVSAGIARLALLGWLLGRVLAGAPLASLVWPAAAVALAIGLRGALDYTRAMAAHGTAARVQARLREMVHAHVLALGPAHFTAVRTGDVILSVVEGVQQLEVYFGQYLPQLGVAALTPVLIFAFMVWLDLPPPDRAGPARGGDGDAPRAGSLAPVGQRAEPSAPARVQRLRGRVP
jgi:ATP-binding cassette subfamily C protein CydCD